MYCTSLFVLVRGNSRARAKSDSPRPALPARRSQPPRSVRPLASSPPPTIRAQQMRVARRAPAPAGTSAGPDQEVSFPENAKDPPLPWHTHPPAPARARWWAPTNAAPRIASPPRSASGRSAAGNPAWPGHARHRTGWLQLVVAVVAESRRGRRSRNRRRHSHVDPRKYLPRSCGIPGGSFSRPPFVLAKR